MRAGSPALAVAIAVLTALVAACAPRSSGTAAPTGTAVPAQYADWQKVAPIRPGFELGFLLAFVDNRSKSAIVMSSVTISGPGIGRVVKPVLIEMAPLRAGYHHYFIKSAVPGTIYQTNPPVFIGSGGCHKQALYPVHGFRLTPGSDARIFVVLRAITPGKYVIPAHIIFYTQHGRLYQQSIALKISGTVTTAAKYIRPASQQVQCVKTTGARYLPGFSAG